ncbi:hypothetical protein DID80_03825 [Candidatus Marinamargulisbacteria bacterium SCGC AAA071-K20]|nr:hypothetical protein DID80_03825 [Candidatus Marinamargulisbacteria bacterium SCGC AAA071-K20]
MINFLLFHKQLLLDFAMDVSNELKSAFTTVSDQGKEQPFEICAAEFPKLFVSALFEYHQERYFILTDAKIIYALSNRMLGGDGHIETRPQKLFTEAESFFVTAFFEGIKRHYTTLGKDVTLLRSESTENQSQPFFKEQLVYQLKAACFLGEKSIGSVYICSAQRSGQ